MAGPLIIHHGSPDWWLSPDIWVTPHGAPPTSPGVTPEAGKTYDVQVRVYNNYPLPVTDWNLFVCWAIPTAGSIPIPPAAQLLNGTPYGSPISMPAGYPGYSQIFTAKTPWTPVYENGGHECLIAVAFVQVIGFPFSGGLNGDAGPTGDYSIGQRNLGVLPVPHMKKPRRFSYGFQACNGADEERTFVLTARQAALSQIAAVLLDVRGGRAVIDRPGKVEGLGIAASHKPGEAELEGATAVLSSVKIPPRSCHPFTLVGILQTGNALINVTLTQNKRVVGGISVLAMADEK
jgi:hypothetical protein